MLQRMQALAGVPITSGSPGAVSLTRFYVQPPSAAQACADGGGGTPAAAPPTTRPPPPAPLDLEATSGVQYPDVSQGAINMCTSMACAHAFALRAALQAGQAGQPPPLAPMFAYYFQRVQECTTAGVCKCPSSRACDPPCLDCGSLLSSAFVVFASGVPPLDAWPIVPSLLNTRPSDSALAAAPRQQITGWKCLPAGDRAALGSALANQWPVVVFWNVSANVVQWLGAQQKVAGLYTDLGPATTAPPFQASSTPVLGHAVLVVGIAPSGDYIVRNSFGAAWGARGRFLLPADQYNSTVIHGAVAVTGVQW